MVLVLEDDKMVADVYKHVIDAMGLKHEWHTTARSALSAFKAAPSIYDYVIADVFLPGDDDGLAAVKQMREIKPDLPVLFATGLHDELNIARLEKVGSYLRKPAMYQTIEKAIRDLVS